jgi:hypothetical protein
LVVFTASALLAGMAAAFLLGNLDDRAQARIGLVVVVSGAAAERSTRSGSVKPPHASLLPRSARESRVSCTTSSPTR